MRKMLKGKNKLSIAITREQWVCKAEEYVEQIIFFKSKKEDELNSYCRGAQKSRDTPRSCKPFAKEHRLSKKIN